MALKKDGKILDVYLETADSQEPDHANIDAQESAPIKLAFYNVSHPEWAAGTLRRTRHIRKVVDFGSPKDDNSHYAIKAIYDHTEIKDIKAFKTAVWYAILNCGIHDSHL